MLSVASAQHRNDDRYQNEYRQNHNHYQNDYRRNDRGCGNNCVLGIIGAGVIGGLIINEMNRPPLYVQPQPIYSPPQYYTPPRIVYVPSTVQCNGGQWINNTYTCPQYAD